jgi:hypothetical protein
MTDKPNNIVRIPCSLSKDFFKYWFVFLRPFHNLTDREIDVVVSFLKKRFELSQKISDTDILNKVLMGEDTKRQIREENNISLQHFQVIMGKLRKKNIIVDNKINPKFIPNIQEESKNFKLLLLFDLNEKNI